MATYQTNAIILRRENVFEADRLYHLYAEDFGMVKAVAGSVRKISAKLIGHLEPFSFVWVELATKKNGDLFITTALSHRQLLSRGASPGQIALFSKMADFSLKMLSEPQKDGILWDFILNSFIKADLVGTSTAQISNASKFFSDFKNDFIKLLGFGDDFNKAKYYLNDFGVV